MPIYAIESMTDVHCAKCDLPRPSDLATSGFPRPPCPNCGATSLAISASISVQARVHVEIYGELVPGDQARGWERRWKNLKNSLQGLTQPVFGVMSGDAIHADAQRLLAFFVDAYNLKDALKAEATSLGINPQAVEDAINRDPRLTLVADLANLEKHTTLSKPPRSGIAPSVAQIVGQDVRGTTGWRSVVTIRHGTANLDALEVAKDGILGWEDALGNLGIFPPLVT